MKVAVVSAFTPGYDVGLESSYARALETLGHEVDRVPLFHTPTPLPRVLRQASELIHVHGAQSELYARVLEFTPDLVLIIKGRGLLAKTVLDWRAQGFRVINLFPDSPFEGVSVDAVARTLMPLLRASDHVLVHDRFAVGQLRQLGVRAEYIAFARDPWIHTVDPSAEVRPADPVVFVGNPDAERIRYLRAVADLGLGLYGAWDWARLSPDDPLYPCIRGGVQLGPKLVDTLRSARLSINILRRSQKTAHNMRTFEVPACNTCCVSEYSVGVLEHFNAPHEIEVFRTPEELRDIVVKLLAAPSRVDELARAGYDRVAGETYVKRARELLEFV